MPRKAPFSAEVLGSKEADLDPTDTLLLPASARDEHQTVSSPTANICGFLQKDLSCKHLNNIDKFLWLAGRPMPPRPLNYQAATSREIVPDERINMHLVWESSRRIHLKPIPRYLLDHQFWDSHLICAEQCPCLSGHGYPAAARGEYLCQRKELYEYSLGLLFSYIALIQYESDFAIAQVHHLIPEKVTWEQWVILVQQLLENGAANPKNINARYLFGELRLSRLNKIYACRCGNVLRGYQFPYQTYGELFRDYLTPLTAMTIYVALVLTAMQVGLATTRLGDSLPFQRASYGFTVFSILGPLIAIMLVGFVGLLHLVNNLVETWRFKQERFAGYELLTLRSP
ncbi:uncharacterized protein N7446_007932 [Penicillium canescens]|uniref:Subtilisin-like serine protease n=1 Tax=Penicillium canescens TaxID=5083 RepID=A0AAD6IN75_PENCN|nr:uncharacterized protein N7446_007932 [Penicillium canescens]KAJ6033775.1 hypothetical protein N7444_011546 [Penicillium canescens]KAJ6057032.1 hypothetical protein N7460_000306 [Penicillium canescens]KAJ6058349.1 hypothetical protein N7446_007932 [Penicillium canescens]